MIPSVVFRKNFDLYGFFIEAKHIMKQNNEELDFFQSQVEVNADLYTQLNQMNSLRIYELRVDNKLVGYSSIIVQPHLQHDFKQATQDVIYVLKEYRKYGLDFLKWCEQQLKDEGVRCIFRSVTEFYDWSLVLKRLNYKKVETIYMRDLRE